MPGFWDQIGITPSPAQMEELVYLLDEFPPSPQWLSVWGSCECEDQPKKENV